MTNFTEEIKTEVIKNYAGDRQCGLAMLSAFIRTGGSLINEGGQYGFELSTESELIAQFFCDIIENVFGLEVSGFSSRSDVASGRDKLVFSCVGAEAERILKEGGILGRDEDGYFLDFSISSGLSRGEAAACVQGAFLGGGSCTVPDLKSYSRTGYHLEVVFRNRITAGDFSSLLCSFDILAKQVMRKDSAVVYLKSIESLSAFLDVIGARASREKLSGIARFKDNLNNENRVNNCSVSNIDKTVSASVRQVQAIDVIRTTIGLQSLDENLFSVAEGRLADKNASMQELADRLKISKSCLNHRIRKIMAIAQSLDRD